MKHYIIATLAAVSLCATSCRDEQVSPVAQNTELTVSQKETLTLSSAAAEHRISVQTNAQGWTCISKSPWLEAKAVGKEIVLSVTDNLSSLSRETTVQVVAGDLVHSFNVKQEGIKAILSLSNKPEIIDQWGAELLVDVNTNVSTWTAESSEDWAMVTPKYSDDQLLVKVVPNDSRYKRTATITVTETTSGAKKDFQLVQQGMTYYILPFTGYEGTKEDLINFETNRGSKLLQTPTEYNPVFKFETTSPIFRHIVYELDFAEMIKRTQVFFDAKKMATEEDKADFYNYLVDEGFDHEGENVYYSSKHQSEVELKSSHVLYTYYPMEKVAADPIDALPLENIEINVTTPEEVKKYQQDLGREYVESRSNEGRRLVFRSMDGDKEELHVYYFSSVSGKLIEAIHFYENMPRYMYTADNQNTYFTRQLRKAIRKSDFSYNYYSDTKLRYSYLSSDRKTEMLIEQVKHPYPPEGQTPVQMVKIKFQVNRNIQF